jgi:hypothetical protein
MAILLYNVGGGLTLFVLSFQSLNTDVIEQLGERMSSLLAMLCVEPAVSTHEDCVNTVQAKKTGM